MHAGPGAEDIGIIIEPHPMTVVDNTTTEKKKDEGDVLSFSSDAPSVQHFNVSVSRVTYYYTGTISTLIWHDA